jgi:hypothetical protein
VEAGSVWLQLPALLLKDFDTVVDADGIVGPLDRPPVLL